MAASSAANFTAPQHVQWHQYHNQRESPVLIAVYVIEMLGMHDSWRSKVLNFNLCGMGNLNVSLYSFLGIDVFLVIEDAVVWVYTPLPP